MQENKQSKQIVKQDIWLKLDSDSVCVDLIVHMRYCKKSAQMNSVRVRRQRFGLFRDVLLMHT